MNLATNVIGIQDHRLSVHNRALNEANRRQMTLLFQCTPTETHNRLYAASLTPVIHRATSFVEPDPGNLTFDYETDPIFTALERYGEGFTILT
jgi:hypothetical protein